jgi:uncharacterized membrane protein
VAAAFSFNWGLGGPQAATAAVGAPHRKVKPIVKHRTIVIHQKAPATSASAAVPRTVVLPTSAPALTTTSVTTTGGSPTATGDEADGGVERGDD